MIMNCGFYVEIPLWEAYFDIYNVPKMREAYAVEGVHVELDETNSCYLF